jgi:hypothetical protein
LDDKDKIEALKRRLKDLETKAKDQAKKASRSEKVKKTVDKHKDDIQELKSKLQSRFSGIDNQPAYSGSDQDIKASVADVRQLLSQHVQASQSQNAMLMDKLTQILEQNEKIAQGVLTVADMIRDKYETDSDEPEPAPTPNLASFQTWKPLSQSPPFQPYTPPKVEAPSQPLPPTPNIQPGQYSYNPAQQEPEYDPGDIFGNSDKGKSDQIPPIQQDPFDLPPPSPMRPEPMQFQAPPQGFMPPPPQGGFQAPPPPPGPYMKPIQPNQAPPPPQKDQKGRIQLRPFDFSQNQ